MWKSHPCLHVQTPLDAIRHTPPSFANPFGANSCALRIGSQWAKGNDLADCAGEKIRSQPKPTEPIRSNPKSLSFLPSGFVLIRAIRVTAFLSILCVPCVLLWLKSGRVEVHDSAHLLTGRPHG